MEEKDVKPTNETDTKVKEPDKPTEDDKKDISELDKLKESNDKFEKELIRGRELKAESQKLESEKMLGGDTGGHIESDKAEETPEEYARKIFPSGFLKQEVKK